MEFLPLSRRRSSARNVPSGEERGEMDVFAGYEYPGYCPALSSHLKSLFYLNIYYTKRTPRPQLVYAKTERIKL